MTQEYDLQEPEPRIHKIFLEEEPQNKIKLRRLDDDDDEVKPVVKESRLSNVKKEVRGSQAWHGHSRPAHTKHTVPADQTRKTEPIKTEPQPQDAKVVMKEKSDIPAAEALNEAAEKHSPDRGKKLSQVNSEAMEDKETPKKAEDQSPESSTAGSSQSEKKARVLGPTLPPHLTHLKTSTQVRFTPFNSPLKQKGGLGALPHF